MKYIILLLLTLNIANAHKLYVLAEDNGSILRVKGYFTKNSPCKNCKVNIFDKNNKLLFTNNTNQNGEITFPYTNNEVTIEVFGSMGHKNKISYESENEVITQNKNESFSKIFFSLILIALIFYVLKKIKK